MITIDHIGMGVADIEESLRFYLGQGFTEIGRFEKDMPKMQAVSIQKDETKLELFNFIDRSDPQVEYMKKHIGFLTNDFDSDLNACLAAGYKTVIPETKGTTVKRFMFLVDSNANYIELLER